MAHQRPQGDEVEALSCCRGQKVIVWYSDDVVYHERLLVWRVSEDTWYILTPLGLAIQSIVLVPYFNCTLRVGVGRRLSFDVDA